jgi:hypothetical protein
MRRTSQQNKCERTNSEAPEACPDPTCFLCNRAGWHGQQISLNPMDVIGMEELADDAIRAHGMGVLWW